MGPILGTGGKAVVVKFCYWIFGGFGLKIPLLLMGFPLLIFGLTGVEVIFCCWLVESSVFVGTIPISVLIWAIVASMVVELFNIPWIWTGNKQ